MPNQIDAFPLDFTEWADNDGDGIGNNLDVDDDNDGLLDIFDAYPFDAGDRRDRSDSSTDESDTDPSASISMTPLILLLVFSFGVSVALGARKIWEKSESSESAVSEEVKQP